MQNRGMTRGNSNSLYFVILVIIESRKNISRKVPKKRNAKRRRRLGGDKLLYYAGLHAKIYYFSKMPRRSKKRFCMFKSSFREAPSKKNRLYLWAMPSPGKGGGAHMQLTYCKPSILLGGDRSIQEGAGGPMVRAVSCFIFVQIQTVCKWLTHHLLKPVQQTY